MASRKASQHGTTRREFVRFGVGAAAALPLVGGVLASLLAACGGGEEAADGAGAPTGAPETEPSAAEPSPPAQPAEPSEPAGGGQAASGGGAGGQLVTEVPAMAATVQALQYVNESQKPDQDCANCQFYTAQSAERGKCQLFPQGLVAAEGWCSSWTARQT